MGKLKGQGGAGRGQGRKTIDPLFKREPFPVRVKKWIIDLIDEQPESRADIVEEALIKLRKLKSPKKKGE